MSKLVDEMPLSAGIFCITGQLQTIYFNDNQRIFKLQMGNDMAENKKVFDELIQDGEISAIFIFDFYKVFFKAVRPIIQFNLKWLEDLKIPVNLMDHLDIFAYNEMEQLYLKHSRKYNKPKPEKIEEFEEEFEGLPVEEVYLQDEVLDRVQIQESSEEERPREDFTYRHPFWPNIIKVSPPYPAVEEYDDDKLFYWKSSAQKYLNFELEQMKAPLGITDDKKNVLVMFSYQMIFQSIFENKQSHYMRVINTIILYLKSLDVELNLFVVGIDAPQDLVKDSKIKLKSFKVLNHGLYKTLTSYANLIITDTPWHPILLDSAELEIPSGVIGNSMDMLEDGQVESAFESTDMEVFKLLEKAVQESPDIFFPYIAFPLKINGVPEFTYYEEKFMYYLLDIFCDEQVIPFLGEFLVSEDKEVTENLKERQRIYRERADKALDTESLLLILENFKKQS
jgi:hypothetical protein